MKRLLSLITILFSAATAVSQMHVSQKASAHASSAPLAATFGSAPATNDVLVATIGYYTPDNIIPPSGWKLLQQQYGNGAGGTTGFISFYHVVAAGESATYTFTGVNNSATMTIYDVVGADAYHPINAVASSAQTTLGVTVTTPAVTPSVLGTLALSSIASEATQATGLSSSGWTYIPSSSASHAAADGYMPSVQSLSPVSATYTLTGPDVYGIATTTILLSPAGTTGHTPGANAGGPYTGIDSSAISFDGSASSDPRSEPLTFVWNFGDGFTETGSMPTHAYKRTGTYTVSLTVTNTDGYTATATTSVSVAQDCSSVSLGNFGALNGFVPSPTDAWHTDVSSAPVDPLSDVILVTNTADLAGSHLHPDFGGNGQYGIPYTVVDSAQAVPITVTEYPDESDLTLFPLPTSMPVEGAPADCTGNGDNHAIVLDKNSCVVYEMYHTQSCSTSTPRWSAGSTALWDLTTVQHRPYGMTSVDAAGLSVFEGLVRYDEVAAGLINHAIRFTAHWTKNNSNNGYFTPPATHAAGIYGNGVDNIEGMRIRLKAGYDISGLTPQAKVIATAMKKYGMILADNGNNLYFQGTSDPRWNDDDLNNLKAIPSTAFEVIAVPLSTSYTVGAAPLYPDGPVYDAVNHPTGNAPVINSFTASSTSIAAGQSVTLTPVISGASYSYIDSVGFIRGPVTVSPAANTTYTLTSRNAYGSTTAQVTVDVVTGITPTLQFSAIQTQTFGSAPFTVSASSASSGAVTYSVVSGPATLLGNVVALIGTGTVTLQATQAAAGNYLAETATTSFNVTSSSTTLQFTPIPDQTYGVSPFAISASSQSSGAVTYSILSGPATLSGNIVSVNGVGTVTIQASQVAAGAYAGATTTISFQVTPATPTLTFNTIADQTYGAAPFPVTASSVSTGTVAYALVSGPATIAGNVVTLTGTGTVTLQASQAAADNYSATATATIFKVLPAAPALTVNKIGTKVVGASPFAPSVASLSQGAVSWTVTGPAVWNNTALTVQSAGVVTVSVTQAAAGNYAAATASTTFLVQDFQLSAPPTLTVQAGITSSASLAVSGQEGFAGTVNLSCSLPATMIKATCSATDVQLSSTSPQGASTVTITTVKAFTQAANEDGANSHERVLFLALLTPLVFCWRRRKLVHIAIIIFGLGLLGIIGCGTGINPGTPAGTYNVSITAASGSTTHSTTVSVGVK